MVMVVLKGTTTCRCYLDAPSPPSAAHALLFESKSYKECNRDNTSITITHFSVEWLGVDDAENGTSARSTRQRRVSVQPSRVYICTTVRKIGNIT